MFLKRRGRPASAYAPLAIRGGGVFLLSIPTPIAMDCIVQVFAVAHRSNEDFEVIHRCNGRPNVYSCQAALPFPPVDVRSVPSFDAYLGMIKIAPDPVEVARDGPEDDVVGRPFVRCVIPYLSSRSSLSREPDYAVLGGQRVLQVLLEAGPCVFFAVP